MPEPGACIYSQHTGGRDSQISMSSRPDWSTEIVPLCPALYRETVSS